MAENKKPKKPQDRKPKKVTPTPDEPFEFQHGGETFILAAPSEVLTVGFARKNRNRDQMDQFFTIIEALADADTLAAIDDMKKDEFHQFQLDFYAHAGIELGE